MNQANCNNLLSCSFQRKLCGLVNACNILQKVLAQFPSSSQLGYVGDASPMNTYCCGIVASEWCHHLCTRPTQMFQSRPLTSTVDTLMCLRCIVEISYIQRSQKLRSIQTINVWPVLKTTMRRKRGIGSNRGRVIHIISLSLVCSPRYRCYPFPIYNNCTSSM